MYALRHSHLNHHLKSEDSREDVIQILENLNHRIIVGINPVTDAEATHPSVLSELLKLISFRPTCANTNYLNTYTPQIPKAYLTQTQIRFAWLSKSKNVNAMYVFSAKDVMSGRNAASHANMFLKSPKKTRAYELADIQPLFRSIAV